MTHALAPDDLLALRAYAQGRRADLTANRLAEARNRLVAAGLVRDCSGRESPMYVTVTAAGLDLLRRPEPMTQAAADWIYNVVLTATYRDSCTIEGNPRTIVNCRCHAGRCGHCGAGQHHLCRTRRDGALVSCETYIVTRSGAARTDVWLSGRPCRWVCSCDCPPPEPEVRPALFDAVPVAVKRHGQPEAKRHRELFGQLDLFDLAGGGQ